MTTPTARAEILARIKKLSVQEDRWLDLKASYERQAMYAEAEALAFAALREEYEALLSGTVKLQGAP